MVKKLTESEFKDAVAEGVCVVDFSAEWCGPCKMLAPVLEEISEELDGKIKFFNVDVDGNMGIAQQFRVVSIPALVVLENGEQREMQVGFQPKDELMDMFQAYIS